MKINPYILSLIALSAFALGALLARSWVEPSLESPIVTIRTDECVTLSGITVSGSRIGGPLFQVEPLYDEEFTGPYRFEDVHFSGNVVDEEPKP